MAITEKFVRYRVVVVTFNMSEFVYIHHALAINSKRLPNHVTHIVVRIINLWRKVVPLRNMQLKAMNIASFRFYCTVQHIIHASKRCFVVRHAKMESKEHRQNTKRILFVLSVLIYRMIVVGDFVRKIWKVFGLSGPVGKDSK